MENSSDGSSTAVVAIFAIIAILVVGYATMQLLEKKDNANTTTIELGLPVGSSDSQN